MSPVPPAEPAVMPVDLGDIGSLAGVVISLIALYFAARAASSSNRSAAASETSAHAAEQSVKLTRIAQHRAEKPTFEMILEAPNSNGRCQFRVRMLDGPTTIGVEIDYVTESRLPVVGGAQVVTLGAGSGNGRYDMVKNDRIGFPVKVPVSAVHVKINVILRCDSNDGGDPREWHHAESVEWPAAASQVPIAAGPG